VISSFLYASASTGAGAARSNGLILRRRCGGETSDLALAMMSSKLSLKVGMNFGSPPVPQVSAYVRSETSAGDFKSTTK
jgi:hypothetical protein